MTAPVSKVMSALDPTLVEQIVVAELKDHEFAMLKEINEAIQTHQRRFSDIMYILAGPEVFKDPSLQVTPEGKIVRYVATEAPIPTGSGGNQDSTPDPATDGQSLGDDAGEDVA